MFPYTEKYTKSESDIQNNHLLYITHPKCQNIFEYLDFRQVQKYQTFILLYV